MRLSSVLLVLLPAATLADGSVPVTLPSVPPMSEPDLVQMLDRLVVANVVSSNCAGYETDMADWGLLTGTADIIADRLGLDAAAYDAAFYGPAFDLLDAADTCAVHGPDVAVMLDLIAEWGGKPFVE